MKANFKTIVGEEESNTLKTDSEDSQPVFSKVLGYFKSSADNKVVENEENLGYFSKCCDKVTSYLEVEKSYMIFFIMLFVGLWVIGLSMFSLMTVLLNSQKFVSLFALGSTIILISFIFVYGTKEYFKMLFSESRRIITILFVFSIIAGFYFSFVLNIHLISLLCAAFQLLTLINFTLSFLPGGQYGISFCWSFALSPFRYLWNKVTGKESSGSFLPM